MTEELKTCPFCGGTDIMSFDTGAHWVSCQTCGAEGPVVDDREDAVAKWNERQTVVVAQGQKSEPYGWHAAANGLFSVDKRCADVWKHHMGLDVTPVYAAPLAEQPTTSDGALDVVDILAMGLCAKTAIKNGGAGHGCWWELGIEAKDAFRAAATNLLDRQSPQQSNEAAGSVEHVHEENNDG
jgi:Lar family restriction alleviation protein